MRYYSIQILRIVFMSMVLYLHVRAYLFIYGAQTDTIFNLVPDAFMRFLLIMMANTIYKLRIVGRENIPREGPALLTPNHVSFADGLFVIATTDRPREMPLRAKSARSFISCSGET